MKEKIFISTSSFAEFSKEPLDLLEKAGFEPLLNPHGRKLNKEEVIALANGVIGIIAGTEKLDSHVLNNLPRLKVISRCGVGTDNVDVEAAKILGIKILNTPDAPTQAVAELAVGLILDLSRNISKMDREIRGGKWKKHMGGLLANKRIGIIGFGRIGKRTAQLLKGFGCELAYYDSFVTDSAPGIKKMSLKELCVWADIVSVHISNTDCILDADHLTIMKKGALLVNTSRGGVVDEEQLALNLQNGHLAGAALDVFMEEPYSGPLCGLDNVVLTPHIGSYARDARVEMEMEAIKNLLTAFNMRISE